MRGAALLVVAALALNACVPGRAIEAGLMLSDIAAGAGPSRLKREAPPPSRRAVAFAVEERARSGDLYLPGERATAALVLVPGAATQGKDDPRLIAFANTLARSRFAVLVPEIPTLRQLRVGPGDTDIIADALRHLAAETGMQVGAIGISYAAGPAILAALREDVAPHVAFVAAVGGYYDLEGVVTFFTTGWYRADGEWRHREPNAYGKWVFVKGNAHRLADAGDARLLAAMAERKMRDLSADVSDLAAGLGPEGGSVNALLLNDDPERVPALIAGLPRPIRDDLAALDLKGRDLGGLRARLLLVHGRDDAIIPYTESLALAAAVGDAGSDLYLPDSLAHVDLGPGGVGDSLTLLRAAYRMLAYRDAVTPR